MTTKIQALLRDFEGTVLSSIEKCSSEQELDAIIASFNKKYQEAKALLNSVETELLCKINVSVYRSAETRKRAFRNNERLESLKKLLFE